MPIGIYLGMTNYGGGGGGSGQAVINSLLASTAFNDLNAFPITGAGSAYGDSITNNIHTPQIVSHAGTNGYTYTNYVNMKYRPAVGAVTGDRWALMVDANLSGSFVNQGISGQTSAQIATRALADTTALTGVMTWSSGTNDTGVTSGQDNLMVEALTRMTSVIAAHSTPALFIAMPKAVSDVNALAEGTFGGTMMQVAAGLGCETYDWSANGQLRGAHAIDADTGATGYLGNVSQQDYWKLQGQAGPHWQAVGVGTSAATGSIDVTHPGPVFSNWHSQGISRMVSAVSGGAPFVHNQNAAVDWSVAQDVKLCDLHISGTVVSSYVANTDGIESACYASGKSLYRGAGAAPASGTVDIFVVATNTTGSHSGRITAGSTVPTSTNWGTKSTLWGYRTRSTEKNMQLYDFTFSTCMAMPAGNVNSDCIAMGSGGIQFKCRGNNRAWMDFPANRDGGVAFISAAATGNQFAHIFFSAHVDPGNAANNVAYFRVNNGAATNFTLLLTTALDFSGNWCGFGNNFGITLDGHKCSHIWFSDTYTNPTDSLVELGSSTGVSAITESAFTLGGVTPLFCNYGGPGNWLTGKNLGSLSDFVTSVPWSAAECGIN